MKRTVSAMEARRHLGELLESVYHRGDEVVIERAGKVMGVVIPADRYRAIESDREWLLTFMHDLQKANEGVPAAEIAADIEAAIREVRDGRRERLFEFVQRIQVANRDVPEEELEAAVEQAVNEARALHRQRGA